MKPLFVTTLAFIFSAIVACSHNNKDVQAPANSPDTTSTDQSTSGQDQTGTMGATGGTTSTGGTGGGTMGAGTGGTSP